MAELKTKPTDADVDDFLNSVDDERRRRDAFTVKEMMTRLSGEQPRMWGPSIVGFGTYTYGKPGAENEWIRIGFSPRKQALTLYLMDGTERHQDLLDRLGSHTTGKACLYIKDLEKVDTDVLEQLVTRSLENIGAGSS